MYDLLATLVAMRTISDNIAANNAALDYLASYFTQHGLTVRRHEFHGHGSLVATTRRDTRQTKVLLYGHIDVAPGTERVFTLREEGDKLYGRGVLDMKSAIAAYMVAVDTLQEQLPLYDFGIMITSDEEYGGADGVNSVPDLLQLGYAADVCILPDSAWMWNIACGEKGHWRFDLTATGQAAHSSRPWEGESASFKLVRVLHELREHFADHGPKTDTLNIGCIHGNGTYNQVPSEVSAQVEIRLAGPDSITINRKLLRALCKKYSVTLQTRVLVEPLQQDITQPLVQAFTKAVARQTGHVPEAVLSYAFSDAAYFAAAGIPCALTYPVGGGHHSEQEWISRDVLEQFPAIILDYLERVARTSTSARIDTEAAVVYNTA